MKKFVYLNVLAVIFLVAAAMVLFSAPAQAYVYDDFTGQGIDYTDRWVDRNTSIELFSQPNDGSLHFSDPDGGQSDGLKSKNPVSGAFLVSMQYSNFVAANNQPGDQNLSSAIQLRLGDGTKSVIILEGENINGKFIQALYGDGVNPPVHWNYISTDNITGGWLGIRYNGILGSGGHVDFFYDFGTGWQSLDSRNIEFSSTPYFAIMGVDGAGSSLSFQVEQVQLNPIPLPPTVLLLGSGLLGLVGLAEVQERLTFTSLSYFRAGSAVALPFLFSQASKLSCHYPHLGKSCDFLLTT